MGTCGVQLDEKDSEQNEQCKENINASAAKKRAPLVIKAEYCMEMQEPVSPETLVNYP